MKKEYITYNHSKTHIRYHIIFSTKYRRDWMVGMEDVVYDVMHDISSKSNFKILHMCCDKNHLHMLVSSCPSFSLYQIVRRLKQVSTRRLFKDYESYFRNFYWKKRHIWSSGYFCSTVGEMSEAVVRNYILNQG